MVAERFFPQDISVAKYKNINETKGVNVEGNPTDGFCFYTDEQGETDGETFATKLCELADAFGEKCEDVFKRALLDAAIRASEQDEDAKDEIILARLNKVLDAVRAPSMPNSVRSATPAVR